MRNKIQKKTITTFIKRTKEGIKIFGKSVREDAKKFLNDLLSNVYPILCFNRLKFLL